MATNKYINFYGCLWAGFLGNGGLPLDIEEMGEAPSVEISVTTTKIENRPTCDPYSAKDVSMVAEINAAITLGLKSATARNLGLFLYSNYATVAPSTLTDLVHPAPNGVAFAQDKWYVMPNGMINLKNLSFKDGSNAAINAGHITYDRAFGLFKITNIGTYNLASIKISGQINQAADNGDNVWKTGIANVASKPLFLRLAAKNPIPGVTETGIIDLFKVQLDPADSFAIKTTNTEVATFSIKGECLQNAEMPDDAIFGKVGRVVYGGYSS